MLILFQYKTKNMSFRCTILFLWIGQTTNVQLKAWNTCFCLVSIPNWSTICCELSFINLELHTFNWFGVKNKRAKIPQLEHSHQIFTIILLIKILLNNTKIFRIFINESIGCSNAHMKFCVRVQYHAVHYNHQSNGTINNLGILLQLQMC